MAFSSGFSPHPRISYANAAPTGTESQAEYVEIGLQRICDPSKVAEALNEVLPAGFRIVKAADVIPGQRIASRLHASLWQIVYTHLDHTHLDQIVEAVRRTDTIEVTRLTKNGERVFDARAAIESICRCEDGVEVVLIHQEPLVRPDDVAHAIAKVWPPAAQLDMSYCATRIRQGILTPQGILDPLDG